MKLRFYHEPIYVSIFQIKIALKIKILIVLLDLYNAGILPLF